MQECCNDVRIKWWHICSPLPHRAWVRGYSVWRSVFPTTGRKEKESQEQTWCKPVALVLCLCEGCSRYIAKQHSASGVCSKFMAVNPLGLLKRIYSYCKTSQEMHLYIGLNSSQCGSRVKSSKEHFYSLIFDVATSLKYICSFLGSSFLCAFFCV